MKRIRGRDSAVRKSILGAWKSLYAHAALMQSKLTTDSSSVGLRRLKSYFL